MNNDSRLPGRGDSRHTNLHNVLGTRRNLLRLRCGRSSILGGLWHAHFGGSIGFSLDFRGCTNSLSEDARLGLGLRNNSNLQFKEVT